MLLCRRSQGFFSSSSFLFYCQGCFSGGQIQSCSGKPNSCFSTVAWNCSPWHLSRRKWFTERGRDCVWGKELCLGGLSLSHSFGFAQQLGLLRAWAALLSLFHEKGWEMNVLPWKTGGRTNKMLLCSLLCGEGTKSLTDARRKPCWI